MTQPDGSGGRQWLERAPGGDEDPLAQGNKQAQEDMHKQKILSPQQMKEEVIFCIKSILDLPKAQCICAF